MGDADRSNGWEDVARDAIARRDRSTIGVATVRAWARTLQGGAAVLDLGCGSGVPISQALIHEGCVVSGIDASPTAAAVFRDRFPGATVACEPAEDSAFFGRTFDGIVAVGLLFLLSEDAQRALIRRVAMALPVGGRFLFSAPTQIGTWPDISTGRLSISLGNEAYGSALAAAGFAVVGEYVDEGESHYYDAVRVRE